MADKLVGITEDERRILLDAHEGLERWIAEHWEAFDLLDHADQVLVRQATEVFDPLRVQQFRAIAMQTVQTQAAKDQER